MDLGAHYIDVQPINEAGWPGGPVSHFLRFNAQPIEGICVSVTGFDGFRPDAKIARGRAYEIEEAETGRRYLVLGDTYCPRRFGRHQILVLSRVFYGLQLELPATQIIWPAGYYGDLWEGKAADFWMRRMKDHEIGQMPAIIQRMARQARSLYCLNDDHISELKSYARLIIDRFHTNSEIMFNFETTLPPIVTDRLVQLLTSVLDTEPTEPNGPPDILFGT